MNQSWPEKVFSADSIWSQVRAVLAKTGHDLPTTPRRPDVRLIVNNISDTNFSFQNPGDHSNSKPENIPSTGDNTAAMIMLKGGSLTEQYQNAVQLIERFHLDTKGLTPELVAFINENEVGSCIAEAYGPASFKQQSEKLTTVNWASHHGEKQSIEPIFYDACSFGMRIPIQEIAFTTTMCVYVQGTNSTPEAMEIPGMVIAVSKHDDTDITRPIAPRVAKDFYGQYFETMPVVTVSTDGQIQKIDLRNGTVINTAPDQSAYVHHTNGPPSP